MGRFFIWCSGAHSDEVDRAERNRFVTMGVLLLLISATAFGGMLVLTGYALATVSLEVRIAIAAFWALLIFCFDRAIATTVNFGGFWRGFGIYVPRILVALTTAILVSEPITLLVFDKEITKQIDDVAAAREVTAKAEVTARHSDEQLRISRAVQEAQDRAKSLRTKAAQLRAEADREERGERSSNDKGCGEICKGLRAEAEQADVDARKIDLSIPALQGQQKTAQADLDGRIQRETNAEVNKIRESDGLLARHRALGTYLASEPSAQFIRWTISLLLLLLELSIVFFKLSGSAHEVELKLRLKRIIGMAEARATALQSLAGDYARRDIAADLELDYRLAKRRRELLEDREMERMNPRRTWALPRPREKQAITAAASGAIPDRTPIDHSPTPAPISGIAEPQTGDLIARRYRLHQPVGKGGYGTVYRATDERTKKPVAVKIASVRVRNAWWNEVRFTSGHERIAKLLKAGQVNDAYMFVVYPFYEPGSLFQYCTTGPGRNRQLSWCLEIIDHVLAALGEAHHADIVHGDIKPDNILLDGSGGDGRQVTARVADWGISQIISDAQDLRHGHWRWTAVEILRGSAGHQMSGELADLYSVGALLYWLISGLAPMEREMAQHGLPHSPEGRVRATAMGLRPERLDRINREIPSEIADLVQDWVQDDPVRRAGSGPTREAALRALRQLRALKQHGRRTYDKIQLSHARNGNRQPHVPWQQNAQRAADRHTDDEQVIVEGDASWDPDATTPGQSR